MRNIMDKPIARFTILIVILAVLLLLGQYFSIDEEKIDSFLNKIPLTTAAIAFIFLYVGGTFVIWYLKDPLKVVGAVLFGAYLSTGLIYVAEIINAAIFFYLTHLLGKDFVEKSMRGKFKDIYEKLGQINMGWIFLLRAMPLIPYRVLDMSFGLSKVSFRKYLIVVLLASPPRIFWIQFVLAGVRSLSIEKMVGYFLDHRIIFVWSLLYLVFTCIMAFRIKGKFKQN